MKFLIDAQLPRRLAGWLEQHGHDALHTLDLPLGNRTADSEVIARAIRDDRIVVTKDSDVVQNFILTGQPTLLLIATGNIGNVSPNNFYPVPKCALPPCSSARACS